ncbi:DNA-binding MarR family transcriptional regulator [Kibdelosporangium banguiense]|uniref:DNA-binding MarR family transcriptional regulator n=1 Tax=Kibdelosporangium banguiense TaxID=1365924 RepID=A0ABS4T6L6_9PSEU|nr:MarR family transcriptional regulator [Kibdelosporangium banguiense]MBP2320058.1 DNA-binding MarR family transcriptional regulator [Kibdelosporangium banguiense]
MEDLVDGVVAAWNRELPEIAGLELELGKRAGLLHVLLNEAAARALVKFKLTKAEYDVLAVLRATGKPYRLKPTELAGRLWLSSGGTSNVLKRLTDAGLIRREQDAGDARSSWVQLTAQGVRTAEAAVRAASEEQRRLLKPVPEETARAAADALREVLLALQDRD